MKKKFTCILLTLALLAGLAAPALAEEETPAPDPVTAPEPEPDPVNTAGLETPVTETVYDVPMEPVEDPYEGLLDDETRYDMYLWSLLYPELDLGATFGTTSRDRLDMVEKVIYNFLKTEIESVAMGDKTSTVFKKENASLTWSDEDLGNPANNDELKKALGKKLSDSVGRVMQALLADCPYELYWFDKTIGGTVPFSYSGNTVVSFTVSFYVAKEYSAANATGTTETKDGLGSIAKTVKDNALAIVNTNSSMSDEDKLTAYKDWICNTVVYDTEAAKEPTTPYGDPWQLIRVFDNNEANNKVVCEGYSKAFQYLCDLSNFTDGTVCYTVSGTSSYVGSSSGAQTGNHMWNVVSLKGRKLLVDVTNSDGEDAVGKNGQLFLAGAAPQANDQIHVFDVEGGTLTYTYGDSEEDLHCEGWLALSPEVASLTITPSSAEIFIPGVDENARTMSLQVTAYYVGGGSGSVTDDVTWSGAENLPDGVTMSGNVITVAAWNPTAQTPAPTGDTPIVIKASYGGQEATYSLTLKKDTTTVKKVAVEGSTSIAVPTEGKTSTQEYTATCTDKYGAEMKGVTVAWSIKDTAPKGVSINASTGELSVTNEAKAGTVTIQVSVNDEKVEPGTTVTITKAAAVATTVDISGNASVTVPAVTTLGETKTEMLSLTATVKDQYGDVMPNATVVWSVPAGTTGVSIMRLSGLTAEMSVTNNANGGTVTVTATAVGDKTGTNKEITINKDNSAATFVQILKDGKVITSDVILIPTGDDDNTATYSAKVYDQYGAEMSADVTWAPDGTFPTGVTLTGGTLNVAKGTAETTVKLKATSGGASCSLTVNIQDKYDAGVTLGTAPASKTYGDADFTVTASVTSPGDGTGRWTWTSSNDTVLKVTGSGTSATVQILKAGDATITAAYESDTHKGTAVSGKITVGKKELTITGLKATDRDYDSTTTVALTGGTLNGLKAGDTVEVSIPTTGTVESADAGANKAVTVVKPTLPAEVQDRYTLADLPTITVTIRQAAPNVGTVTVNSPAKIYTSHKLSDITLQKTGNAAGTLALNDGQTLTAGTKSYGWTFTPTDTTNYKTVTGTISLEVHKDTLQSIAITKAPTKTAYKYGEAFDKAGMTVTATYESGTEVDVTGQVTIAPTGPLTMGTDKVTVSFTKDGVTKTADQAITVAKAAAPVIAKQEITIKKGTKGEQTYPCPAGLPADRGTTAFAAGKVTDAKKILAADPALTVETDTGTLTYTLGGTGDAGDSASFQVTVTMGNYEDAVIDYTITLTDKDVPAVTASDITVTYTGEAVPASAITGTATFGGETVAGTWAFKGTAPKAVADSSASVAVTFTPTDTAAYAPVSTTIKVTINKATPTGTPAYTPITAAGKTLADASLAIGTITPIGGAIAWDDGNSQAVTANTAYGWTYTPADAANYNTLTGRITPYVVNTPVTPTTPGGSSGGSSGGGSSDSSDDRNTTTETTRNPDGSTTTTVTDKKTGTVTETTRKSDGSSVAVQTQKDGTVTTTERKPSGLRVQTVEQPGRDVTASVFLPRSVGETTVTLPVDVSSGTVAKDARTGEIIKLSVPTADGVKVKVDESVDLILVDNSKAFSDTRNHWAEASIDFVTARELFSGTTGTTFTPNRAMTRAMLMTVLARLDGADASGSGAYEKGMEWARNSGVSDGSNPNGTITREQLAAMLWRYAGSPASAGSLSQFTDAHRVSSYADDAMRWAVENGIIGGMGNGTLAPQGQATRAQVAAMLARFVEGLVR